ncbi:ATP-dependent helicase [Leucobacter sp. cx-42]|uniref:UvrD-helicase domain-containing protein n=1 Tax=unclassified Leucobacter TaxID=2621730 RepID=UPI00165E06B7|nr:MULTISPECIES: UvrD-helicase domain-containing protein [unclassified Leucobacter]MBC9955153.1 ATP-dependent helicase [Leucobacter sp. cx-42]
MTSRVDKPDTKADKAIRAVLGQEARPVFVVVAGAGSGKTTSLVKALAHVTYEYGAELRARTQQVACITYTEVAAHEIHVDVSKDPLVLVSTIHSFLWGLIKPFQADIKQWVTAHLEKKENELKRKIANYSVRVQAKTKERDAAELLKYQSQRASLGAVTRFVYGTGSDYGKGVLGHEDVLTLVPELIMTRPLLAKIASRKYPFIFVDESQDTFPNVVECLKQIHLTANGAVCLGFFGDPMQQIYQRGAGTIQLEAGWIQVPKPENFRSSDQVLETVNAVRAGGDSLVQTQGRPVADHEPGEVFFFVLPADGDRTKNLDHAREWLDENSAGGCWTESKVGDETKILTIAHRMAARRLGFGDLYSAFKDNKSSLGDDFLEGNAWPLRAFDQVIFPVIDAGVGSESAAIEAIRKYGVLLTAEQPSSSVKLALGKGLDAARELRRIAMEDAPGSIGAALNLAISEGLIDPDPRLSVFLDPDGDHSDVVISGSTSSILSDMVACRISEIRNYRNYVEQNSPYSTQHGTKGSEFEKVIVVMDDEEGRHNLYSYEKYFGLRELSATDLKNQAEGAESVIDRTRRLFYVCVSRAKRSLAVVLFTADVENAKRILEVSRPAGVGKILTLDDL